MQIGLTDAEAARSKEKFGDNRLTEIEREGFFDKLKHNFGDPLIKILLVALAVNILLVFVDKEMSWYEPVGIAIAILLATLVSAFSEHRNENAFQKLQADASRIRIKTYRNGLVSELAIDDLVVGDAVLLQPGDKVPADGKIIDGNIKVDESALNGEPEEVSKKPGDEVLRGSVVCNGNAIMCVSVVGDKSVYGQIAAELQASNDRDTPLKVKLTKLAKTISKFGYMGGAAIAFALLFKSMAINNSLSFSDFVHAFTLAVVIIVMAVPEGLPLMIAIVSSLNMKKMLRDNVLVRKISGIETAGSLNFLFSDKTGTITKGKLEVTVFIDGDLKEKNFSEIQSGLKERLSLSIHQNTDSIISGDKIIGGNATERAILAFAGKNEKVKTKIIDKIPFNSANKYSSTTIEGNLTLIKGAPEKIIDKCKFYYDGDGQKKEYTRHGELDKTINTLAERAIRAVAFAICEGDDWVLVGVVGIRDEIRSESVIAIKEVFDAGVGVVMITGDRKETAVAIARDAGLLKNESDIVLTSDELAALSDEELKAKMKNIRVVARALPSDKSRLVRISQELNYVVGMTGDGVNDSPALKKADVGFAMGSGTEVAKEASDIVILDDNFSSIDKAILYGRAIFNNIRKFIIFQLTINVSAVLISFAAPLLGRESPLTIIQILWINLIMDSLAALAFGGEAALRRFMKEKPKRRDEPIISRDMRQAIGLNSAWIFVLSLVFLFSPLRNFFGDSKVLHTAYFTFFVMIAAFNAFNARTDSINIFDNISGNKSFLLVFALIAAIQVLLVYFGGEAFKCYGLDLKHWGIVLLLAVSIIPVDMLRKKLLKAR
ncbi:MAG: calcium-translocating P-type ATPase, PMCA-type [Fibromonadaceae bacterium]|jgi:calcium-translocating P-type ATPase|nr:calcium-translocating P-type ATPase, PMCA-type [Fibromonadaceae bacterium]